MMEKEKYTIATPNTGDKYKTIRIWKIGRTQQPKFWFNSENQISKPFQKPTTNKS